MTGRSGTGPGRRVRALRLGSHSERAGLEVAPRLSLAAHAGSEVVADVQPLLRLETVARLDSAQTGQGGVVGRHSQAGARVATHGVAVQLAMREADARAATYARVPTDEGDAGGSMTSG